MSQKLYEQDFYAWTLQQAELLRSQTQQDLDWANLAEELEDMGKNLKRELESRLKVLFAHLLKWQYQPSHRGHSWQYTIEEQRNELADHLADRLNIKVKVLCTGVLTGKKTQFVKSDFISSAVCWHNPSMFIL